MVSHNLEFDYHSQKQFRDAAFRDCQSDRLPISHRFTKIADDRQISIDASEDPHRIGQRGRYSNKTVHRTIHRSALSGEIQFSLITNMPAPHAASSGSPVTSTLAKKNIYENPTRIQNQHRISFYGELTNNLVFP